LTRLLPEDRILTSVVNIGELLRGMLLLADGRRKRELLVWYQQTIPGMDAILPVTLHVAERFAQIDAALRKSGRPIPVNDVWVAATTLAHGATLVTNDEHFARVEGLRLENWT
jgi:predicted nucleic acid-binding protein